MLSKVYSSGVYGIEGFEVTVECSAWDRVPAFELVGLPDTAVKEAKDRGDEWKEKEFSFGGRLLLLLNVLLTFGIAFSAIRSEDPEELTAAVPPAAGEPHTDPAKSPQC